MGLTGEGRGGRYPSLRMLVHLNGQLVPASEARVSVFDRGFLFGDGVYEGLRAFGGWVRCAQDHAARMQAGLDEAGIRWDASQLPALCAELLAGNGLADAFLYWQVTRGTPEADEPVRARLPGPRTRPTVFGYCLPTPGADSLDEPDACAARTVADERWLRGHVKSTSLMGNVMAAMEAASAEPDGAAEALLVRGGFVSESCATNIFIALHDRDGGGLVTPPVGPVSILDGVTRRIVLGLRPDCRLEMVPAECLGRAREIFLVGTLTTVRSVVSLDGRPVGGGGVGPEARDVLARYRAFVRAEGRA